MNAPDQIERSGAAGIVFELLLDGQRLVQCAERGAVLGLAPVCEADRGANRSGETSIPDLAREPEGALMLCRSGGGLAFEVED
jgi:hypothetical protein